MFIWIKYDLALNFNVKFEFGFVLNFDIF